MASSESESGELNLVALAKQQRQSPARTLTKSHAQRAAAAGIGAPVPPPPAPQRGGGPQSESDSEPFDIVAAAKKSSASRGQAVQSRSKSGAPAAAPGRLDTSSMLQPGSGQQGRSASVPVEQESDSDEGLDMIALSRQHRRLASAPSDRSAAQVTASSPTAPAKHATPSSKPVLVAPPAGSGAALLASAVGTAQGEENVVAPAGAGAGSQAAAAASEGASQAASVTRPAMPSSAAGSPGAGSPGIMAAPTGTAVPLASLAELSSMVQQSMNGVVRELRSDIGQLEAGWQAQWKEQANSNASLRGMLDRLQASSTTQAQEVQGRLQSMQAELAQHRSRLEAVELQQKAAAQEVLATHSSSPSKAGGEGCGAPASPAASPAAVVNANVAPPAGAGTQAGSTLTVEAIMRRLSLLEDRVSTQLHHMEAVCVNTASSPRSAPTSPLKSGAWKAASPTAMHRQSRSAHAAAMAATVVYGDASQGADFCSSKAGLGWDGSGSGLGSEAVEAPASPRILASSLSRPASAAAAYCQMGGSPAGTAGSRIGKARQTVDQQVAETHAIIAGIHSQISAIKSSLACTTNEVGSYRQEAGNMAQRLDRLELCDHHIAQLETVQSASTSALERRMQGLEDRVAVLSQEAAAGGALGRSAHTALSALEWRVDKSTNATLGTIKALEARQDKLRSQVHSVGTTAALADAKAAALTAEVARLQRRIHSPPAKTGFRLY